jgi:hypothetical protein
VSFRAGTTRIYVLIRLVWPADSKEERLAITPHIYPILAELNDEDEPYLLYLWVKAAVSPPAEY